MRFIGNDYYGLRPDAFEAGELSRLRGELVSSPLLGGSQLSQSFDGTRGFSVSFTRAGLPALAGELAYLAPYLDRVLRPSCNAFYLNPLLMHGGTRVDAHVDASLSMHVDHRLVPLLVSVLYVEVPADLEGGELVLELGDREVGRVAPREGTLLFFAGLLRHHVTPMRSTARRLSLVCEQYRLDEVVLAEIPTCQIVPGMPVYERSAS